MRVTTNIGYKIDISKTRDLVDMVLHDSFSFKTSNGDLNTCIRVNGGWIYQHHGIAGIEMIFVGIKL